MALQPLTPEHTVFCGVLVGAGGVSSTVKHEEGWIKENSGSFFAVGLVSL